MIYARISIYQAPHIHGNNQVCLNKLCKEITRSAMSALTSHLSLSINQLHFIACMSDTRKASIGMYSGCDNLSYPYKSCLCTFDTATLHHPLFFFSLF